jgi:hypothetical protein
MYICNQFFLSKIQPTWRIPETILLVPPVVYSQIKFRASPLCFSFGGNRGQVEFCVNFSESKGCNKISSFVLYILPFSLWNVGTLWIFQRCPFPCIKDSDLIFEITGLTTTFRLRGMGGQVEQVQEGVLLPSPTALSLDSLNIDNREVGTLCTRPSVLKQQKDALQMK